MQIYVCVAGDVTDLRSFEYVPPYAADGVGLRRARTREKEKKNRKNGAGC